MWWSRALLIVSLLALGPAGCGFRPLYGKPDPAASASPAAAELALVRVEGIADRTGQQLRNALVQRLSPGGEPASARYTLEVTVNQTMEGLAATRDGNATLGRMRLDTSYRLKDAEGTRTVTSGSARALATFRMLGPRYGTMAVERDAEERALSELAEDIRSQLAVFFANRNTNASAGATR